MNQNPKSHILIQTETSPTAQNLNIDKPNSIVDVDTVPNEQKTDSTPNKYKCTLCCTQFSDLSKCLNHELTTHANAQTAKSQLSIKKKTKTRNLSLSDESEIETQLCSAVTAKLSECSDDLVLQEFCKLFQLPPDILNANYQRICDDLIFELNNLGKFEIHPFGSTVNAMALKSSDMDFYVNFITNQISSNKNINKMFYKVHNALLNGNLFTNVIPIPRARVPVIKCTNNFSGVNLDLTLSSRIGVFNSEFIGKVINFDNRIHPILLVIKVWAKLWEITKTGRITNYCLTLLVFFYLQNCQPPILPSIKQFQENCEELLFDGYNFAFKIPENFNSYENTENILELLRGFFKFYKKYDYKNSIVCPYLGTTIEKNKFSDKKFNYPEYEKQLIQINSNISQITDNYKIEDKKFEKQRSLRLDTPIVVQDPFCLTINKFNTGRHIFAYFYNRVEIANKIMSENDSGSFGNLLIKLLYDKNIKCINLTKKINPMSTTASPSRRIHVLSLNQNNFTLNPLEIELTFIRNYLRKKYPEKTFNIIEVKKNWCDHMISYLINILEEVYKIKVNIINNENYNNQSVNNAEQADIHLNDMIKKYKILSNLNLWTLRQNKSIKRGYATYLEKTLESTKILEDQRKFKSLYQANLNCDLIFKKAQNYSSIRIEMINNIGNIGKKSFKTLFDEYSFNTRNVLIAYFARLSRQY